MISLFVILFFIAYSLVIFLVGNIYVLLGALIFNLLLIIIFRLKVIGILKNLLAISIFVLIVFAFNLIFDSLINSLIICAKIILVCNFSYIISKTLNIVKIAEGITYLLYPLKLFKVDINQISLMIVIALNFVSIITKEAKSLKLALKARNINFNLKTLFTKSHTIFIMFFANIFKRVDMLELSLRSKNFN